MPIDCLLETDNKLVTDNTNIIINKNDFWCEYVDIKVWDTANNSDFVKMNVDIITTATPEVVDVINEEFEKLID